MPVSTIQNASLASGVPSAAKLPAGSVLQVVNAQFDNPTQVSTTSTSPQSTVLTLTITPTSATSKILVMANTQILNNAATNYGYIGIYRNGSVSLGFNSVIYGGSGVAWVPATNISYDSPATTSATTYTLYYKAGAGQVNVFWGAGTSSTITAMEIAA
jgi:hypothetical protein